MTTVFVRKLLAVVLVASLTPGCAEEKKKDVEAAVVSVEKLLDEHGGRLAALENGNKTLQAQLTALEGRMGELSSQMAALDSTISKIAEPPQTGPVTATELSIVDKNGKGRIKLRVDDQDKARLILLDKEGGAKGDVDLAEVAEFTRLLAEFRKDPMLGKFLDPLKTPRRSQPPRRKTNYGEKILRVGEFEYQVKRAFLDDTLADLSEVARGARVIPSIKEGKLLGYKLVGVRPGSVYRAMGIRSGDTIMKVNGQALDSPETPLALYEPLKTADKVELLLSRRGSDRTHTYYIVDDFSREPYEAGNPAAGAGQ